MVCVSTSVAAATSALYPARFSALAAALANPWADVVLSGAATPGQLAHNLTALEVPHAALADLPEMAEDPSEYWTTRNRLAWT